MQIETKYHVDQPVHILTSYKRSVKIDCSYCEGTGLRDACPHICPACHGRGFVWAGKPVWGFLSTVGEAFSISRLQFSVIQSSDEIHISDLMYFVVCRGLFHSEEIPVPEEDIFATAKEALFECDKRNKETTELYINKGEKSCGEIRVFNPESFL